MKYRLREGVTWENVKSDINYSTIVYDFEHYFEPVPELPKVELAHHHTELYDIEYFGSRESWIVYLRENGVICASVDIGKEFRIKSVAEFNEKCSQLFGFELVEVPE